MFAPTVQAPARPDETRYCIPLDELIELSTFVETAWFNVQDVQGGEGCLHVEVSVGPTGRVLELCKVHQPGKSETLATVKPASTPPPSRPSGEAALPPQILDVSYGIRRATIESWDSGSCTISRNGLRAFAISGDRKTYQLSVNSVPTGETAARIERTGVNVEGAECLELVVYGHFHEARIFILACVLAVVTLRSWPGQPSQEEQAAKRAEAKRGPASQYPHLISVAGVSSTSLHSLQPSMGPAYTPVVTAVTPHNPDVRR